MPKLKFRPRLRHVLVTIIGVAIFISTFGSILETLDFGDANKPREVNPTPTVSKAYVESFKLETTAEASAGSDPQDSTPVNVVQGNNVTFSAHVFGVRDFFVSASTSGSQEPIVSSRSQPDASGNVSVSLKLPRPNVIYSIEAYGIVKDKLRPGWTGGSYNNDPAVTSDAMIRVMPK